MQIGDLITYRSTYRRKDKHHGPMYSVIEIHKDGTLTVLSSKTGQTKTISRPELYTITGHTPPPEAP